MKTALSLLALMALATPGLEAQLRRPGLVTVEREDRTESRLVKEDGAIYLEGMVEGEVPVRIVANAPVYANLKGDRWLGSLLANQNAVLLAVSEKAYRVRGRAKQGQVAGWVSKAAVAGLAEDFEEKLARYHERHLVVGELIRNKQVALGMTTAEVLASLGPPDRRQFVLTEEGRHDTLEFVSYRRVPQTVTSIDAFGRPVVATQYVEVEAGRVTVEFAGELAVSISESEGFDVSNARLDVTVPPFVALF